MRRLLLTTAILTLLVPATAGAATRFVVRGGGFGHGLGMSQYGAYGQAKAGRDYRTILHHYYTGVDFSHASRPVRVLLMASAPSVTFTDADRVGSKQIRAGRSYTAVRVGGAIVVKNSRGKRVARSGGVLRVTGPNGYVTVSNKTAAYRDVIELRPGLSGGVTAVNKVGLENYVRGVVPLESPASWPQAALRAQAVAARTYALGTDAGGPIFDQYDTTASQVYGGLSGEDSRTDRAVAKTRGEILRYHGEIITAYFHSTSGGHTEDNENIFAGSDPLPYIRGVKDPWDKYSPYHRWGPIYYSPIGLGSALGVGKLRRITHVTHGASPRILRATFHGTRATKRLHGYMDLKPRLGLRDAPFSIKRLRSSASTARASVAGIRGLGFARDVSGDVTPARAGAKVVLQRRVGKSWKRVARGQLGRHGGYRIAVDEAGYYRIVTGGAAGPTVRVR